MTKTTTGRRAWLGMAAVAVVSLAALGLQPAGAARKSKTEEPAEPEPGEGAVSCTMYGDGVLDVMGQSAAYLFIGDRPVCTDAGRRQRFCTALQTREGYDAVREQGLDAEQAEGIAKTMPEEMRAFFLKQHPRRSLEQSFVACGLKPEAVRAKLAAEAAANIQAGKVKPADEDLEFLRREAPAMVEAMWNRECAGRVTGKSAGESGLGVEFKGNRVYEVFCWRTTRVDKDKAPGRFGH